MSGDSAMREFAPAGNRTTSGEVVDLAALVDGGEIDPRRVGIFILILFALLCDGYDITVISFVAPAISKEWALQGGEMAGIFSAGIAGMIVGSLLMGMIGDRYGRRPALIASIALASCGMFASAATETIASLAAWRFVSGIGIGAILPVALVLAGEYAPARRRWLLLTGLYMGFSVGGMALAGLATTLTIDALGWRGPMMVGGSLSLIAAISMFVALPESLKFLFSRGRPPEQVAQAAARLSPAAGLARHFVWSGEPEAQQNPRAYLLLFAGGRRWITPLLWLTMFAGQLATNGLILWMPTLLGASGVGQGAIVAAMILFAGGSSLGPMAVTRLVERHGAIAITLLPAFSIPALTLAGFLPLDDVIVMLLAGTIGFCVGGTVQGFVIAAGAFYPTAVRAKGVSLAVFVSRFGSVLGPPLFGLLMTGGTDPRAAFHLAIVPMVVALLGAGALGWVERKSALRGRVAISVTSPK